MNRRIQFDWKKRTFWSIYRFRKTSLLASVAFLCSQKIALSQNFWFYKFSYNATLIPSHCCKSTCENTEVENATVRFGKIHRIHLYFLKMRELRCRNLWIEKVLGISHKACTNRGSRLTSTAVVSGFPTFKLRKASEINCCNCDIVLRTLRADCNRLKIFSATQWRKMFT